METRDWPTIAPHWALGTTGWMKYPASCYPPSVVVCPLCGWPETEDAYENECHCWDEALEETE